jgi:hypothetical protein
MHPGDVAAETIALATDHGNVTVAVVPDATVREGVVSITHGHAEENPSDLTSDVVGIDGLTAMPRVAGLDVRVAALDDQRQPGP